MLGYFMNKLVYAPQAFTFEDFILLPNKTYIEPREVNISSKFSTNIRVRLPFASSPMDTVTEARMAIAMAESGGIGVLHRNCSKEEQVRMAIEVKSHEGLNKNATVDENGRLICAAAISPFDKERAITLDKYVDALVIDVAHFHNEKVLKATHALLKHISKDLIVGNIGTYKAAEEVLTRLDNISGLRVGIGSGSICITSEQLRVGAPTLFATAQVADALKDYGAEDIPIIADGGIRSPGDIALALAVGASTVMLGNLLARCEESAGEVVFINGKKYKRYRGMASPGAMARRYALDRYSHPSKDIAEGVEGLVPYEGKVCEMLDILASGLKVIMGYIGAKSIKEIWYKARLLRISPIAWRELGPHDIMLLKVHKMNQ